MKTTEQTESSNHTPGPWTIKYSGDGKVAFIKGLENIAEVDLDYNQDGEANAKLIASAPQLLEENAALKASNKELVEALTLINGMCADASNQIDGKLNIGKIASISISAIRKAETKQ